MQEVGTFPGTDFIYKERDYTTIITALEEIRYSATISVMTMGIKHL